VFLAPLILSSGLLASAALDAQQSPPYVDRIAAVVGDHVILLSEVRSRASLVARTQHATLAQITDAILRQVTEHLVEEQLEEVEAKRLTITVSQEEIDRAVEQLAQGNNTSVTTFVKEVEKQGISIDELKDALRRQLVESKLLLMRSNQMQRIEEKDVRTRYEQMKRQVKDPKDLKTYDELKNEIVNELLQERIQALREDWIAQLRARTYVEVRVGSAS
jgi:peptidyl-prolyl cis-trans isomerase SurA